MKLPPWLLVLWQKTFGRKLTDSGTLRRGVDISEFNGKVDFQALSKRVDFAILRCGYGSDYTDQDDARFAENVRGCQEAGIPYGVYLYAYARNEDMAKSEAAHVLRLVKGTDPAYGVWYDVEDESLPYQTGLTSICKTWCDAVLAGGITCVGLYASLSVMSDYLNSSKLGSCEKWVAQWGYPCQYPNPGMWQYTDKGKINGKVFDMNFAYRDYPDITGANMTQDKFDEMLDAHDKALGQKPVDDWAKDDWKEACAKKLFDGTAPRSPLTREQAAALINRLAELLK